MLNFILLARMIYRVFVPLFLRSGQSMIVKFSFVNYYTGKSFHCSGVQGCTGPGGDIV